MLSILTECDGSGRFDWLESSGSLNNTPSIGCWTAGYFPSRQKPDVKHVRSDLDHIHTGRARFARDHDCDNLQIFGEVVLPSMLTGAIVPYNPLYDIPIAQRAAPSSLLGYDLGDMLGFWGINPASGLLKKWRSCSDPYALRGEPGLPFLLRGETCSWSYAAATGTAMSMKRWSSTACVGASRIVESSDVRYPMIYSIRVAITRTWNDLGIEQKPTASVMTRVTATGPTSATHNGCKIYSLSPLGVWGNTTNYTLPSFLANPTPALLTPYFYSPLALLNECIEGTVRDSLIKFPATYVPVTGTITVAGPNQSELSSVMESFESYIRPKLPALSQVVIANNWDDLGDTAADGIQLVSINTIAYLADVRKTFGTFIETGRLLGNWRSPKQWANWWLSVRYGDRLSAADTQALMKAGIETLRTSKEWKKDYYVSRSCSTSTVTNPCTGVFRAQIARNVKLYFRPVVGDVFAGAYRFLDQWGLWPTLSASWDLIPLSFAVDWFVDIQGFLKTIDRDNRLLMNRVLSVLLTEKRTFEFDDFVSGKFIFSGVRVTDYHRNVADTLPSAPFRVDRGHSTAVNVIDGAALIYQRLH